MKFTILHLIPTLEGGGAERQLSMLAPELSRRGASVHVGTRRRGVYATPLLVPGISMHSLGDHRGLNPRLLGTIHSLLRAIQPDIVQTWLPQMDILGGIACRWRGIPWILSERVSERAFRESGALFGIRRFLGRRACAVVANSDAGAGYWRALAPVSTPVAVVRNAVDVSAVRCAPPVQDATTGAAQRLILVVGRLHRQKAMEIVLQALPRVSRSPEFRVLILGDGPQRPWLEGMIRDFGLADRVAMLPYKPDWWGLLKAASALVSVSRYEGHPNVVLETMAAGCPLIVSDIPEHREFLNETSALLVPPEDPPALAQAINCVLRDGQAARRRADIAGERLSELSVAAVTDAYEAVYQQVLQGRAG